MERGVGVLSLISHGVRRYNCILQLGLKHSDNLECCTTYMAYKSMKGRKVAWKSHEKFNVYMNI